MVIREPFSTRSPDPAATTRFELVDAENGAVNCTVGFSPSSPWTVTFASDGLAAAVAVPPATRPPRRVTAARRGTNDRRRTARRFDIER
jgi:hypothetical protein